MVFEINNSGLLYTLYKQRCLQKVSYFKIHFSRLFYNFVILSILKFFSCLRFCHIKCIIYWPYLSQVTDTNDNPPIFTEPAYSFDISENAPRGHQVGVISADDADLGANAAISYTVISDWANDVFSLNPQTGVFTLTARLDYEEVSFEFTKEDIICISLRILVRVM